jgi:hypothetical protein
VATSQAPEKQDLYAVIRLDSFRNFTPRPENITVKKLHENLAHAEFEVRHLNGTAPTGTVYFIQRTSVVRRSQPAAAPAPTPAPEVVEATPPSPRSRRARAEKKAKKSKKKGRRK